MIPLFAWPIAQDDHLLRQARIAIGSPSRSIDGGKPAAGQVRHATGVKLADRRAGLALACLVHGDRPKMADHISVSIKDKGRMPDRMLRRLPSPGRLPDTSKITPAKIQSLQTPRAPADALGAAPSLR